MSKKKSDRTKPEQSSIPGTRTPKNVKVERAAKSYVDARDQRMSWGEDEKKAKAKLIAVLISEEVEHYETDEWIVDLTVKDPTQQVKVKERNPVEAEAAE